MARNRIGVLHEPETSVAKKALEEEQARVRKRVEALETGGDGTLRVGRSIFGGQSPDRASLATEFPEATDEDVAAAVRAAEERGDSIYS